MWGKIFFFVWALVIVIFWLIGGWVYPKSVEWRKLQSSQRIWERVNEDSIKHLWRSSSSPNSITWALLCKMCAPYFMVFKIRLHLLLCNAYQRQLTRHLPLRIAVVTLNTKSQASCQACPVFSLVLSRTLQLIISILALLMSKNPSGWLQVFPQEPHNWYVPVKMWKPIIFLLHLVSICFSNCFSF